MKVKWVYSNLKCPYIAYYCIPEKRDTMDHAQLLSACAEISSVQPTSHISFGISFKLGKWLAMPSYSFGSPGVKIMLW